MVSTLAIICSAVYAQAVRGYLFQTDASPLVCFAAEMSDSIQTKAIKPHQGSKQLRFWFNWTKQGWYVHDHRYTDYEVIK